MRAAAAAAVRRTALVVVVMAPSVGPSSSPPRRSHFMRKHAASIACAWVGSLFLVACNGPLDPTKDANAQENVATTAAAVSPFALSSPFLVGSWKFIFNSGGPPGVDTEFRFVNPTAETLNLEYAYFDPDGTFCGCHRAVLPPNATGTYTVVVDSLTPSPNPNHPPAIPYQFSCRNQLGALKAIVFKNNGQQVVLDDATQVGFQTHAFAGVMEPTGGLLTSDVMTEATMAPVTINASTRRAIQSLHQQCVTVQGPLP
jgi:hypothetical protein